MKKPKKTMKRKNVHEQIAAGRKRLGLKGKTNGAIPPKKPRRPRAPKDYDDPDAGIQPLEAVELGPLMLPEGKVAEDVLKKAADLNDRALQAHKAYLEQAELTKKAKRAWQDLVSELQQHVRLHTHESTLPILMDIEQRERDQTAMETAANPEPF